MREVEEWIGKTDDQRVPPRVRMRIFDRYGGRCYLSDIKIMPGMDWDVEHIVARCNGGQHRESNMAPALKAPHKGKTRADRREKARIDKLRKRHLGIRKPSRFPGSRDSRWRKKLNGEVVER